MNGLLYAINAFPCRQYVAGALSHSGWALMPTDVVCDLREEIRAGAVDQKALDADAVKAFQEKVRLAMC